MSSNSLQQDLTASLDDRALDLLFRDARTYNEWLPEPMPEADIRRIYELAKLGPTSANGNPARFIWAQSAAAKEKVAACVNERNVPKVLSAAVVVIIGFDTEFHRHFELLMPHAPAIYEAAFESNAQDRYDTAFRNSSLQGAYLIMAARALGYDCGPLSGFQHEPLNKAFFDGSSVRANFICCIGRGSATALMPRNARFPFERINEII